MLKLKLQYFDHLMQRVDSLEKTLLLGGIGGRRRRGRQRMRWFDGITNSMDMGLCGLWDLVMDREGWHSVVHGIAKRSNQSILKEISPGCSLEGMRLNLNLQYFGHLMRRVDSLEKTLMLGGIAGRRKKGTTEDEMARWHHRLDGHEFE